MQRPEVKLLSEIFLDMGTMYGKIGERNATLEQYLKDYEAKASEVFRQLEEERAKNDEYVKALKAERDKVAYLEEDRRALKAEIDKGRVINRELADKLTEVTDKDGERVSWNEDYQRRINGNEFTNSKVAPI